MNNNKVDIINKFSRIDKHILISLINKQLDNTSKYNLAQILVELTPSNLSLLLKEAKRREGK